MKVFLAITCAITLVSCADLEKSDRLAHIDSMLSTIDSIEVVFLEHKVDSIAIISNNTYSVENRIKNNYFSDTINMELGRKMDAYKLMRKRLGPMRKAMYSIEKSIEEERTKLQDLRTDIASGSGERSKYDEYIAFEQEKVAQINTLLNDYVEVKVQSIETYRTLHEELDQFSHSLLKKPADQ